MPDLTSLLVALPKPSTLQFAYPKDWGSSETGLFGALADGSIAGAIKTGALGAAAGFAGNNAEAAAQAKTGKTINKRNKAIFRDLPFRAVSFAWTLRPRNKEKAQAFIDTIKELKIKSAPKLITDGSLWDTSEATWSLTIKTDIGEIFKANELVIQDIQVDYTPNGFWSQHKDGYPTQIQLSISLMEVELAHQDKLASEAII